MLDPALTHKVFTRLRTTEQPAPSGIAALTPQERRYLLPLKIAVRRAEGVELGDTVTVELSVDDGRWR